MPENQNIDFLSIDAEGLDFEVLKSNNFEKYRPKIILIELIGIDLSSIENNEVYKYLKKIDYSIYGKAIHTVFFVDNKFKD